MGNAAKSNIPKGSVAVQRTVGDDIIFTRKISLQWCVKLFKEAMLNRLKLDRALIELLKDRNKRTMEIWLNL